MPRDFGQYFLNSRHFRFRLNYDLFWATCSIQRAIPLTNGRAMTALASTFDAAAMDTPTVATAATNANAQLPGPVKTPFHLPSVFFLFFRFTLHNSITTERILRLISLVLVHHFLFRVRVHRFNLNLNNRWNWR